MRSLIQIVTKIKNWPSQMRHFPDSQRVRQRWRYYKYGKHMTKTKQHIFVFLNQLFLLTWHLFCFFWRLFAGNWIFMSALYLYGNFYWKIICCLFLGQITLKIFSLSEFIIKSGIYIFLIKHYLLFHKKYVILLFLICIVYFMVFNWPLPVNGYKRI